MCFDCRSRYAVERSSSSDVPRAVPPSLASTGSRSASGHWPASRPRSASTSSASSARLGRFAQERGGDVERVTSRAGVLAGGGARARAHAHVRREGGRQRTGLHRTGEVSDVTWLRSVGLSRTDAFHIQMRPQASFIASSSKLYLSSFDSSHR